MEFEKIYKDAVDNIEPSAELSERLLAKQEAKIVRFNKKKIAVVVAVACMLCGTTALAGEKIASYRSSANPYKENYSYEDAVAEAEELGSKLALPQAFSNGYTFESSNTMDVEGLGESGNVVGTSTDFTAVYTKDSMPNINMFIEKLMEPETESCAVSSREIGDVTVYFNQATYKFVPVDYELTEEDKQNLEDPHYEISVGSDQVEVLNNSGVSFEKDEEYYSMFAWDSEMSEDEWYAMAEEWLAQ